MKKQTAKRVLCAVLVVVFCAVIIAADVICTGTNMYKTITEYFDGGLTVTDLDYKNETFAQATTVGKQMADEGIVLLKNNGSLPLEGVGAVNLFGYTSAHLYIGGSGSGQTPAREGSELCATLKDGFNAVGIEVNDTLFEKYLNWEERINQNDQKEFAIQEPEITDPDFYSEELWESYEQFSDVAILVLGRISGEGVDIPHGYLTITDTERALLDELESRFEYVYVLINSTNVMELGFLEEDIDGAILLNMPGYDGAYSVAEIMTGAVNPSGHLADTYAYDLSSAPSYYTASMEYVRKYTGIEDNEKYQEGYYYTDYLENIYVGYRYYETAGEDGFINYEETVQYPFGYGLSYTTFDQEIVSVEGELSANGGDTISVTVKVTNTGDVAGKDVVQLYASKPYYTGEIEKSAVDLVAFEKTDLLEPGASQQLVVQLEVQDLASYDYNDANNNGHMGYELDAGDYVLSIRSDSHTELDSRSLVLAATTNYDTDTKTGTAITNLFDDADGGNETAELVYLSRANWAGTFPTLDDAGESYYNDQKISGTRMTGGDFSAYLDIKHGREASEAVHGSTDAYIAEHYKDNDPVVEETPVTGADNGLTLSDMVGLSYDDEQWNALLDQMTVQEMSDIICNSAGIAAQSVGFNGFQANDGPSGITAAFAYNGGESSAVCYGYPNNTSLACTWNKALAYAVGQSVGEEAIAVGTDVWYAPGGNIHRTPYGGRNFEYYSEDGILAGYLCANTVAGCLDKGCLAMVKHFGLNETETCRNDNGLYCWCSEQALRELYLKPFEMAVKDGGAKAIMTSFCRIGTVWCGASEALIQGVLYGEWGFDGYVSTDAYCPMMQAHEYQELNSGLRAGTNTWLGIMVESTPDSDSNYALSLMRDAMHHILYAATFTYEVTGDAAVTSGTPLWFVGLIAANVVIFAGSAAAVYLVFLRKNPKKAAPETDKRTD